MRFTIKLSLALSMLLAAVVAGPAAHATYAQTFKKGKIAFISNGNDILLYDLDSGLQTNVTQGRLAGIVAFAWSPDATQLVVSADRGSNLYVVGADGGGLRPLTHNTGFAITQTPTWSPDGTQIAYVVNSTQNYDVALINADGTGQHRLTNTDSIYRDLAWSPDGSRIAYASGADFFNVKIYVMNADGTGQRALSTGNGDVAPAWSPDGSHIAYENDLQFGPPEISVMKDDGTGQTRLTNNFRSDRHPAWSPDGTRIAFSSDRDGSYAVYTMSPDGSNQTKLTSNASDDLSVAWQPDPSLPKATPTPTPTPGTVYSVSGRIVDFGGSPLSGVQVTLELNQTGTLQTRTVFTDVNGLYASGDLGCQNGVTVTPTKPGYSFNPQKLGFVSTRCLSGTGTADFVGISDATARYTISGHVTDGSTGVIAGATVTLGGTVTAVTQTDASGAYSFAGLPAGGNYTLSATKQGQYLRFARSINNLSGNLTVDISLIPYVTLSVRVTDATGAPLSGVAINIGTHPLGAPLTGPTGIINISVTYSTTVNIPIPVAPAKYGYTFVPSVYNVDTTAGNQTVTFVGTLGNKIDDPQTFAHQHYLDFFGRDPDAPGLQFWTQNVAGCADTPCIEVKRIDTSAAFFLSIEFQQTGYLVYRAYKVAYGNLPNKSVPLTFAEFLPDTQAIDNNVVVGQAGWEQVLETNKQNYFNSFVSTARFQQAYPASMTAAQFVDALNTNSGNVLSPAERDALVSALASNTQTRAQVVRAVAEDADMQRQELNRAFVLMQYFGYLRRDPDDAGYQFWLQKLNNFSGDFRAAEMVKAFITSGEYRARFGTP